MKKTLGFAIIGCGTISKAHISAIGNTEDARLVSVCDVYEPNLTRVSGEQNVPGYADYREMLKRDDIDVVCILTASGTHAGIGIDAANAGKHLIVEKPLDVTVERALELVECCERNGVVLSGIFQNRFSPAIVAVKQAAAAGRFGRLHSCCCHTKWYRNQAYYDVVDWRGTLALDGGGALINQSIHYVDLMQYIMGDVQEVFGYTGVYAHERIEGEDVAAAAVKFRSGAVGLIEATTAAYPGFYTRLDIQGSDGTVLIEDGGIKHWEFQDGVPCDPALLEADTKNLHNLQYRDIADAIRSGRPPAVTGREALKALGIVRAVYESNQTGAPVKLA